MRKGVVWFLHWAVEASIMEGQDTLVALAGHALTQTLGLFNNTTKKKKNWWLRATWDEWEAVAGYGLQVPTPFLVR